jgi:hypothetical protein
MQPEGFSELPAMEARYQQGKHQIAVDQGGFTNDLGNYFYNKS